MKPYLLTVSVLVLLVAILGLPPRYSEKAWWAGNRNRTPERATFLDLQKEIMKASWLHQRLQWRDSVAGVLQRADSDQPFLVQVPEGTPASLLARVDSGISLQLRALNAIPPRVSVGVFLIPRTLGLHPAAFRNRLGPGWSQREVYVAREGEKPFCALVEPVGLENLEELEDAVHRLVFIPGDPRGRPNTLRICGYYARYGVPGAEIEDWLRRGGSDFASGVNMERRVLLLPSDAPRGPFGLWIHQQEISPRGMACLGGVDPVCASAFLRAEPPREEWSAYRWLPSLEMENSPVDFLGHRYRVVGSDFGFLEPYLLQELEGEFGPDRFARFWRSDEPVLQAFQSAFGMQAGTWTRIWAQRHLGRVDRGPAVPLQASVLSLVTVGLLGVAAGLARRRRN